MRDIAIELRRLDLTLLMVLDGALRHRKLTIGRPTARPDAAGDQPRLDQAARHSGRSPVRSPRQRRAADAARARPRSAGRAGARHLAGGIAAGPPLRSGLRQPRVPHRGLGLCDCHAGARLPGALQHHRARLPPCFPHAGLRGGAGRRWPMGPSTSSSAFRLPIGPFLQRTLMAEDFVVLARPGHPIIGRKLDLAHYLQCGHLLVSAAGDARGSVDNALGRIGKERRVVTASAIPRRLCRCRRIRHDHHRRRAGSPSATPPPSASGSSRCRFRCPASRSAPCVTRTPRRMPASTGWRASWRRRWARCARTSICRHRAPSPRCRTR